jgi:hypothetical protein
MGKVMKITVPKITLQTPEGFVAVFEQCRQTYNLIGWAWCCETAGECLTLCEETESVLRRVARSLPGCGELIAAFADLRQRIQTGLVRQGKEAS